MVLPTANWNWAGEAKACRAEPSGRDTLAGINHEDCLCQQDEGVQDKTTSHGVLFIYSFGPFLNNQV